MTHDEIVLVLIDRVEARVVADVTSPAVGIAAVAFFVLNYIEV